MFRALSIAILGLALSTAAYPCSGKYLGRSGIGAGPTILPFRQV